jgi:hypothetical protein
MCTVIMILIYNCKNFIVQATGIEQGNSRKALTNFNFSYLGSLLTLLCLSPRFVDIQVSYSTGDYTGEKTVDT